MDVKSEELFGNESNAKNFELNFKIKIGQKGIILYSKRGNNVQMGQDNRMRICLTTL